MTNSETPRGCRRRTVLTVVAAGARDLDPGYFALVMATGIISIVCDAYGLRVVARLLLQVNLLAYGILAILTAIRLGWFLPRVLTDLGSHAAAPGFFSLVAGTCTLGSQLVILEEERAIGFLFWGLGTVSWCVLMYAVLLCLIVHDPKPDLASGLDGRWLLAVVATQSVALLGAQIASRSVAGGEHILFFSLALYLVGCMLYVLIIALIFQRLLFFPLTPQAVTPAYWIVMGATAISTLSGASLMAAVGRWALLGKLLPFLTGLSLLFWTTGTWWVPLLLLLEVWRHGRRGMPIRYDPGWWGVVFPLGMYATCTFALAEATGLTALLRISQAFTYVGLGAWIVTGLGLAHRLWSGPVLGAMHGADASCGGV